MKRVILPILLFFLFLAVPMSAHAQVLKLQMSNPSQTFNVGDTATINILINTNGISSINGDALISFDPAKLSIQSAQSGNFFTYFSSSALGGSTTKYLISSWEESIAHAKSSSSDTQFASFIVKAVSNGSTRLSFDCTAGTGADSNINQASDSSDIINCSALSSLTLTIGASLSSTPTPTGPTSTPAPTSTSVTSTPTPIPTATSTPVPTSTPRPTSTPKPTVTPKISTPVAGTAGLTVAVAGIGTLLTVIGILAML